MTKDGNEAALLEFADADALRQHLDDLNENGEHPVAVGWTAQPYPVPFLITLVGCYADGEDVLFDSPWQSDIQWTNGSTRCEECHGHAHGISDLRYPVTVMARWRRPTSTACRWKRCAATSGCPASPSRDCRSARCARSWQTLSSWRTASMA